MSMINFALFTNTCKKKTPYKQVSKWTQNSRVRRTYKTTILKFHKFLSVEQIEYWLTNNINAMTVILGLPSDIVDNDALDSDANQLLGVFFFSILTIQICWYWFIDNIFSLSLLVYISRLGTSTREIEYVGLIKWNRDDI